MGERACSNCLGASSWHRTSWKCIKFPRLRPVHLIRPEGFQPCQVSLTPCPQLSFHQLSTLLPSRAGWYWLVSVSTQKAEVRAHSCHHPASWRESSPLLLFFWMGAELHRAWLGSATRWIVVCSASSLCQQIFLWPFPKGRIHVSTVPEI